MRFTSPPDQQAYREQVWHLVRQVPHGSVVTYGQVANLIPLPAGVDPQTHKAFGPRWVGSAMAACPNDVPWQRVVNSQGKISNRPGATAQQQLLEDEGVVFVNGKLELKHYQWRGPNTPNEPRQARLF